MPHSGGIVINVIHGEHMHKQPIFEARTFGYHTYRIPGIAIAPGGVILATAEARPGKGGDWDFNEIVIRRSEDGGENWDDQRLIVRASDYGDGPASNFCMIPDAELGCTHAVFCHNYNRIFYTRTDDDGLSFADPVDITFVAEVYREDYPWRVVATGPAHGIKTSKGRLIVPLWMSDGSGSEFGAGHLGHRPSNVAGIYSDDGGRTWAAGDAVARDHQHVSYRTSTASVVNPSETIPVELSDGRILFNLRTESSPHKRMISISRDGATGWGEPQFDDDLTDTVCMASIIRLDEAGSVLFAAPDNMDHDMPWGNRVNCDRKRLSAKLRLDDCTTWSVNRIIEEGPAGYSDLAVAADGTILCLYECGQITRMGDDKYCMLARFDREWIEKGNRIRDEA